MKLQNIKTWAGCLALACTLIVAGGCAKLRSRDQLNKGVASYKAAKYPQAIEFFKQAIELEPTLVNAKLYSATAYANQYVPGSEQEENVKYATQAIATFQEVLQADPSNISSIIGIANLYFQMKQMPEAKEYYQKQISLDPTNPEAYYSIGVIDWTLAYQPRMELKASMKLKPDEPIKDAKARAELAAKNAPLVDEAMKSLNKSLELRPDYDDAMAYLNLLYRERADLSETTEQRDEDLKTADQWMEKALQVKKEKAAKAGQKKPAQ